MSFNCSPFSCIDLIILFSFNLKKVFIFNSFSKEENKPQSSESIAPKEEKTSNEDDLPF